MAGILEKITDFFTLDDEDESEEETTNQETTSENAEGGEAEKIDLSTIIGFVRELEAYYTNDIFKMRSSYMNDLSNEDKAIYFKKKILEYETSVKEISQIKNKLLEKERSCKELWGKSAYSFYEELEATKLSGIFKEAFDIVKQLIVVNSIPELEKIIGKRLKQYQKSWNLSGDNIPKNRSLQIVDRKNGVETYKFGDYQKEIVVLEGKKLSPEKILAIKSMKVSYKFEECQESLWIRCAVVTRKQLDFIHKTAHFPNDWEKNAGDGIIYDIVPKEDVESYVVAMTELLLPRKDFVLITMINPSSNFISKYGNMMKIDETSKKAEVVDKTSFLLLERSGFNEDLKFCVISSKSSLKEAIFCKYGLF